MLNTLIKTFCILAHDIVIFHLMEFLIISLTIFAFTKGKSQKYRSLNIELRRGKKARKYLLEFTSLIVSGIMTVVVDVINIYVGYKIIIFIFNTVCICYVCLLSPWGRNRIIGLYSKFEAFMENY